MTAQPSGARSKLVPLTKQQRCDPVGHDHRTDRDESIYISVAKGSADARRARVMMDGVSSSNARCLHFIAAFIVCMCLYLCVRVSDVTCVRNDAFNFLSKVFTVVYKN